MGVIQAAILDALGSSAELTVSELCADVERRVGRSVTRDTVTSFLSVAARDPESPVIRVARAVYRLAKD